MNKDYQNVHRNDEKEIKINILEHRCKRVEMTNSPKGSGKDLGSQEDQ